MKISEKKFFKFFPTSGKNGSVARGKGKECE